MKQAGKKWSGDEKEDAATRLVEMDFHELSACYAYRTYQRKISVDKTICNMLAKPFI